MVYQFFDFPLNRVQRLEGIEAVGFSSANPGVWGKVRGSGTCCIHGEGGEGGNERVQAFSPEGRFGGKWGFERTSGATYFKGPRAIAVDAFGVVYVVDTRDERVQVFRVDLPE